MKVAKILFTLFVIISSQVASAYYKYDETTGNSYNVNEYGGETHIQGSNSNTGSNWNTTIDQSGNQRGTDSEGNYWNYNSSTGYYSNSNGTSCYGKGAARTCN